MWENVRGGADKVGTIFPPDDGGSSSTGRAREATWKISSKCDNSLHVQWKSIIGGGKSGGFSFPA